MFFYLSKFFWLVAAPSNLIAILLVAAVAAFAFRRHRAGRWLACAGALLLVVAGWLPLGAILLRPLEDRFSRPASLPSDPAGIVVLGGGIDENMGAARGTIELSEAGGRMAEAAALAHRYPRAKLVFAGGSAALLGSKHTEAAAGRLFFLAQGINPVRIVLEDKSRNTRENAEFTRRLVDPKPGEVWLLVTSAWHMPRSMGIFRQVGFPVTAWPTDYSTHGTGRDIVLPNREVSKGLKLTDRAVREWIGLFAYYLTGRTDALLPGPRFR